MQPVHPVSGATCQPMRKIQNSDQENFGSPDSEMTANYLFTVGRVAGLSTACTSGRHLEKRVPNSEFVWQ